MSSYSISFQPKKGKPIPDDIMRKAKELCYIVRFDAIELYITPNRINLVYGGTYWDYCDSLEKAMKNNMITQGAVEVYAWLKDNAECVAYSHNPNDFDYGPWNMKDFIEGVDKVIADVKDWKGPVAIEDIKEKLAIVNLENDGRCVTFDYGNIHLEFPLKYKMYPYQCQGITDVEDGVITCSFLEKNKDTDMYEVCEEYLVLTDDDILAQLDEKDRDEFIDIALRLNMNNVVQCNF